MKKIAYECFRNNWPVLPCFVITLFWFGVFACIGLDSHHDGIMLKPAVDVAGGQVLFRDSFTQYGALTIYIQALSVKLFGPYLIVIRLLTALFYALSSVLLYRIWRNFLSPTFFWITYLLFCVLAPFYSWIFHPWSSVYALFFMLLSNALMLDFIKYGSNWRLWAVGASSALAFWCRQPNGIVMFIAFVLFFFIWIVSDRGNRRKTFLCFGIFVLSFSLCSFIFIAHLIRTDALADWYCQSIRFAFSFGMENTMGALLANLFPESVFIIFPIITITIFGAVLLSFLRSPDNDEQKNNLMLIITALIALGSWHQYHPVPCQRHLYWASIPMMGFYAYAIQQVISQTRLRRLWLCAKILFAIILLLPLYDKASNMINDSINKLKTIPKRYSFATSPLKNMLLDQNSFVFFSSFQRIAQKIPSEYKELPWINLTANAFFNLYFPNDRNIFPMYVNWSNTVYHDYNPCVLRFLLKNPSVIIVNGRLKLPGYRPLVGIKDNTGNLILFYIPVTTKEFTR